MDIGFILDVLLGSEYASEVMFHLNVWSLSSYLKIYKNIPARNLINLKLKVQILKEWKHEKYMKYFLYARQALCNCHEMFTCHSNVV